MKRSTWVWFAVSGLLAILAGIVVVAVLSGIVDIGEVRTSAAQAEVVVARVPIGAETLIRADHVKIERFDQVPSGAFTVPSDAVGCKALRDISEGEILKVQDVVDCPGDIPGGAWTILEEDLAVALPADDLLSQWGAVAVGDHVDVLLSLDMILETPLYPDEVVRRGETLTVIQRDQSMDQVSVLALQNLEVMRIIQEPQAEGQEGQAATRQRALVLRIDPQDAVLLKYFRDSVDISIIDMALRSPENDILFDVEPVNINYLLLRYGIALPEPLR